MEEKNEIKYIYLTLKGIYSLVRVHGVEKIKNSQVVYSSNKITL